MKLWYQARFPHYRRHLTPVLDLAEQFDVEMTEGDGPNMIVAGIPDADRTRNTRRLVLVEHGAGQLYRKSGSWVDPSGNLRPVPDVTLYLAPNQTVADHMADKLPNAERIVVGSPAVEALYWKRWAYTGKQDRIVFAVHWRSPIGVPEAGSSWPWSQTILKGLVERYDDRVVAHAHPRIAYRMKRDLKRYRIGVPFVDDWDELACRAAVLVCDNSSIIWEATAVGIPVALIDPPNWNPNADHNLRWGDEAAGFARITGRTTVDAVAAATVPNHAVYGRLTGSTRKAVDAVIAHVGS